MKRTLTNVMLAAALMVAVSTVASAQTVKAEIPFPFRAHGVLMAPGTYTVTASPSDHRFAIYNIDSRRTVLLDPGQPGDAPTAWRNAGKPMLEFACTQGSCGLQRVWTASTSLAYSFVKPKKEAGGSSLSAIRLVVASVK